MSLGCLDLVVGCLSGFWRFFLFLHKILHTRLVDSPVMMWNQIRARGVRGHAPSEILLNGEIWRILNVPKYVIHVINLKINIF